MTGGEPMIPAQDLVERGVAAVASAEADGCVIIVEEGSHADVRFAVNTTTTNGVNRSRSVGVVVFAGGSAGTAQRSGAVGLEGVDEMVLAARADAEAAPPAEDAFALVQPGIAGGRRDFGLGPEHTDPSVLDGVLSSLSGAFSRAKNRDAVLAGFAEHDVATLYLGSSTGLRLSDAQPTSAVSLVGRTADGSGSAWVAEPSIDPSMGSMEDEIWRRLDWAAKTVALEAGRYEVILPPSAVADMMATLAFDGLSGRDAEDGRTVFSREGGGTRVGDQLSTLPFTLYSDAGEAGIECTPFVATRASSSEVSVYDNGLPTARTDWIRDGVLAQLRYHRAGAARCRVSPWGRTPTTWRCVVAHRAPERRRAAARSTTWWRAPSAGSSSPACGTSARSIPPRCSRRA